MARGYVSIEYYRTKFYQREKDSKKFLELSEEQLCSLAKFVYKKQEKIGINSSYRLTCLSKLERYENVLQYLTNPVIHSDLKTFDERAAFLIMMVDPNLIMFREFLKTHLISISEIDKVKDEDKRNNLMKIRNQNIAIYESLVREKIGFFDIKLLKYEEMFFKRFFNEKELITEVEIDNQEYLTFKVRTLKKFNSISDERYEQLVNVAQTWLSLVSEKYNFKVATYSVINQYKLLGLTNLEEQLTLLILLIDRDLDMLKIYEEESMMQNIKDRIIEQFGFFNKDLLDLERKFYDRFCPDKELSAWTKTKKR